MTGVRRVVGVIGGMGPAATVDFLARLVAAAPARRDQDHPRVLVDSDPSIPDRSAAVAGRGSSPGPALARAARGLESSGAEFIVMPCNTAHAFADHIRSAISIPFIDMIDTTAETAATAATAATDDAAAPIGILATAGCLDSGLYQAALSARGTRPLVLDGHERDAFDATVYAIKADGPTDSSRAVMIALAASLAAAGARTIIAGCTELPLVLRSNDVPCLLVNSTDTLVARTIELALGITALPPAGRA